MIQVYDNDLDRFWLPRLGLDEVYPLSAIVSKFNDINVFDIGANRGFWTMAFLQYFGDRVRACHLFEPMSGNIEDYNSYVAQGRFDPFRDKIFLHPNGVSNSTGEQEIHFDNEKTALASLVFNKTRFKHLEFDLSKSLKIRTETVADAANRLGIDTIHCMKIDTEGHEFAILEGAVPLLDRQAIKSIVFEFGPNTLFSGLKYFDFFEFFHAHGYSMYEVLDQHRKLTKVTKYDTQLERYDDNRMLFAAPNGIL